MKKDDQNESRDKGPYWFMAAGVVACLFGFSVLSDPIIDVKGGYSIDMGEFQVPMAVVAVGVGIYFIWSAFMPNDGKKQKQAPEEGARESDRDRKEDKR